VGVISHVEELRTRISSRLEVLAGRDGSRLSA
jgi:exonuclease SbcC